MCSFVDQPDVITHVGLVKPKPSVFVDDISHILVVCTVVSVLLIGVSVTSVVGSNGRVRKDIKLYATDMTAPSEVTMSSVVGTKDGRIFMCGTQDGNLYELHYQEKEGWFDKKVHLINHSVGGVQSLFPRFSPPSSVGQCMNHHYFHHSFSSLQIGSRSSYRTPSEAASTRYRPRVRFRSTGRPAENL
jgi:nuclear pore complex protein Nup155